MRRHGRLYPTMRPAMAYLGGIESQSQVFRTQLDSKLVCFFTILLSLLLLWIVNLVALSCFMQAGTWIEDHWWWYPIHRIWVCPHLRRFSCHLLQFKLLMSCLIVCGEETHWFLFPIFYSLNEIVSCICVVRIHLALHSLMQVPGLICPGPPMHSRPNCCFRSTTQRLDYCKPIPWPGG